MTSVSVKQGGQGDSFPYAEAFADVIVGEFDR